MRWDAEIEVLAEKVRAVFGDDAVADAFLRAVSSVPMSKLLLDGFEDVLLEEFANNTRVVDRHGAQEAFRLELQRLLRPH